MSIYVLIAAIATTPTTEMPIVNVPPPITIYTPTPSGPPPVGKVSNPIPKGSPSTWATTLDYPALALREEREGTTAFKLTINKEGQVSDCAIAVSSGHPDLDKVTCDNITRRAEFFPAQDKQGKPTTGQYSNRVRWQIPRLVSTASYPIQNNSYPRAPQIRNPADLRISKEDYPASAVTALQEGVSLFNLDIDDVGRVRSCAITSSSGYPALDQQSCALARKWTFEPARDLNGMAASGRTSHNIRWRLPKGSTGSAPVGIQRPRNNPFEKAGEMTMTLDFDKEGKLNDCLFEHKGELPIFGSPPGLSENFCKNGMQQGNIKPFQDAKGNPEPRRVIVKISVDHAEVPAATPKEE